MFTETLEYLCTKEALTLYLQLCVCVLVVFVILKATFNIKAVTYLVFNSRLILYKEMDILFHNQCRSLPCIKSELS